MADTFVGLDLETSGIEHGVHRTIQVGVCTGTEDSYDALLYWRDGLPWSDEAEKVHGISQDRLFARGLSPETVDHQLYEWLQMRGTSNNIHAVGWNVGSFDLPFVRRDLPLSSTMLSYRSVDLNSLCFALANSNKFYNGSRHNWDWWKKTAKKYAEKALGSAQWHDALYDAKASILAYHWLSEQMR